MVKFGTYQLYLLRPNEAKTLFHETLQADSMQEAHKEALNLIKSNDVQYKGCKLEDIKIISPSAIDRKSGATSGIDMKVRGESNVKIKPSKKKSKEEILG